MKKIIHNIALFIGYACMVCMTAVCAFVIGLSISDKIDRLRL